MYSIRAENLTKSYGGNEALRGVSFEVSPGEIFGIIGPDGAGKTSIFRILATLVVPDGGSASVLGLDVVRDYHEIRRRVGYMPGRFSLYQDLSVEEKIRFFATLIRDDPRRELRYGQGIYSYLEPFRKRKAGPFGGMMQHRLPIES